MGAPTITSTICGRCQQPLPEGARFCDSCGAMRAVTEPQVEKNPLMGPTVRNLIQRAENLRADGHLGAALDLVQEASVRAEGHADWAQLEASMRARIARTAVETGGVGEPLPGTRYDPMRHLRTIRAKMDCGPAIGEALLAFISDNKLVRIPSGALRGQPSPESTLEGMVQLGEAQIHELPGLRATAITCGFREGRVWVAGERQDGLGHTLVVHDRDGWREVVPTLESGISRLTISAQGRRLAVGTESGKVILVDTRAGSEMVIGGRHLLRSRVVHCGGLADGELAYAWGGRGQPVLLGTVTGAEEIQRLAVPHHDITDVATGAGGRLLITVDEVGQLCFFRADTCRQVGQVHLPVIQDPQVLVGGMDTSHESALIRPGGDALHCYEFHYQVFVGEPVHVVRSKPEEAPPGSRVWMDPCADYLVFSGEELIQVYDARMRPVRD